MNSVEKIILGVIPIVFILLGTFCIFKSRVAYKNNLKIVEDYAQSVKNIPVIGFFAAANVAQTKLLGIWFIRFWGVMAVIIGLLNLYTMVTQGG